MEKIFFSTLASIINPLIAPFVAFKILCIWKYYGKSSICSIGAIALFSIILLKVFKTLLNFFLNFFNVV